MPDRQKVHISRVEYGPTAADTRVILSDGRELDGVQDVQCHRLGFGSLPTVTVTAYCKGATDA